MGRILFDVETGEVFSDEHGWNKHDASIHTPEEWLNIIYRHEGRWSKDGEYVNWSHHLLALTLPVEQERFT